jgi:hypothetical protein
MGRKSVEADAIMQVEQPDIFIKLRDMSETLKAQLTNIIITESKFIYICALQHLLHSFSFETMKERFQSIIHKIVPCPVLSSS